MGSGPSQSRIRVAACEALDPPAVSVIEMSFFESGSDKCASEDRARFLAKRTTSMPSLSMLHLTDCCICVCLAHKVCSTVTTGRNSMRIGSNSVKVRHVDEYATA